MATSAVKTKRRSARSIAIQTNIRCQRIYPTKETQKSVSDLETVGIKLNKDQAIHLARVLLAVTQDWDVIDITGYRLEKPNSAGLYRLTVTSAGS
jgi:hypothetical protein